MDELMDGSGTKYRWTVDLLATRNDGYACEAVQFHSAERAGSYREAAREAAFNAQQANPSWDVHVLGAQTSDDSPFPPGWNDSGLA